MLVGVLSIIGSSGGSDSGGNGATPKGDDLTFSVYHYASNFESFPESVFVLFGIVPNPGSTEEFQGTVNLIIGQDSYQPDVDSLTGRFSLALTDISSQASVAIDVYDKDGILFKHASWNSITDMMVPETSEIETYHHISVEADLIGFPLVTLTVSVVDNSTNFVTGLTLNNFFIYTEGRALLPASVIEHESFYIVEYNDITCGKRDLTVCVIAPPELEEAVLTYGYSNTVTFGNSYALLSGIENYPGENNDLNFCVDDVDDVHNALLAGYNNLTSMWSDTDITILIDGNATKTEVFNNIDSIAENMEKYDLFLFYFSGHGSMNPSDNTTYLCTYDNDEWISVTEFSSHLELLPDPGPSITNAFVLIDACHSGNFIGVKSLLPASVRNKIRSRPFIQQQDSKEYTFIDINLKKDMKDLTNTNTLVMTASKGNEESVEDWELENGLFTYHLVEGLTCVNEYKESSERLVPELDSCSNTTGLTIAPANTNGDSIVTAEELFDYVVFGIDSWATEENGYDDDSTQIPQIYDNNAGVESRLVHDW